MASKTTVPTFVNFKLAMAEVHRLTAEAFDAQQRADEIWLAMGYESRRPDDHNRSLAASYRQMAAKCVADAEEADAEDARRAAAELGG